MRVILLHKQIPCSNSLVKLICLRQYWLRQTEIIELILLQLDLILLLPFIGGCNLDLLDVNWVLLLQLLVRGRLVDQRILLHVLAANVYQILM